MNVNNVTKLPPVAHNPVPRAAASGRTDTRGPQGDTVTLSAEAQRLHDADGQKRLDGIRAAIKTGRYTIDLDRLAAAMVAEEQR